MIKGVGHIGLAVRDIEEFLSNFCSVFALERPKINIIGDRQIKFAVIDLKNIQIEVVEDYSSDGLIAKFLKENGPGIHHICLESDDIVHDVESYVKDGVPLIDLKPKIGIRGKKIAFLSPKAFGGILLEVSEP